MSTCAGRSSDRRVRWRAAKLDGVECTYGPVRSEDAIPFPHTKAQCVRLVLLPFDPHLARAYQFPAIHPESGRLRAQVLFPVR